MVNSPNFRQTAVTSIGSLNFTSSPRFTKSETPQASAIQPSSYTLLTSCKNFEICRIAAVVTIIYGFKLCFSAFFLWRSSK